MNMNWWKWAIIVAVIFAPGVTFKLSEHLAKGGVSFGFSLFEMVGEERQKSIKETEDWLK